MRNERLKQAKKFIPGLTVTAQKTKLHSSKYGLFWEYLFSITTNMGRYTATFTDSINNHNNKIPVNLDDILYSWIVDTESFWGFKNFEDFCIQYGYSFIQYDMHDERYKTGKLKAKKAWNGCKEAYKKMHELLTTEQVNKLHELFEGY